MQEIEERLRQPIPTINPDMTLPAEIAQRIAASAEVGAAAYGRHKEGGDESKVLLLLHAGVLIHPAVCFMLPCSSTGGAQLACIWWPRM